MIGVAVLISGFAHSQWTKQDLSLCAATGLVRNTEYGFEVRIPAGLRGCPNSPVGLTNHGVMIPLMEHSPEGSIEVYAAYNALFHMNLGEAADSDVAWLRQEEAQAGSVAVVSRRPTLLGTLKATLIVVRYRTKSGGIDTVSEAVVALRTVIKTYEGPSHLYRVTLVTPAQYYERDRRVLDEVVQTWRVRPTADGH